MLACPSPGFQLLAPLSLPKGLQGKGDTELVRWGIGSYPFRGKVGVAGWLEATGSAPFV